MPPESKSFFIDHCPVCQNPKPCALHDQELREAILNPEQEEPGFEKMAEWDFGMPIQTITRFVDGKLLLGGRDGKIKQVDLSEPNPELKILIDCAPPGKANFCSISKITPVTDSLFAVKMKMGVLETQQVIDHEGKIIAVLDGKFDIIKDEKNNPILMMKSYLSFYEFYDFSAQKKRIGKCAVQLNLVAEHPIFLPNHQLLLIERRQPGDVGDRILSGSLYHFPPDFTRVRIASHLVPTTAFDLVPTKKIYFSNNAIDHRYGNFYPLSATSILFKIPAGNELGLLDLTSKANVDDKYDEQKHVFESNITAVSTSSEFQFVVGLSNGSVYHCDVSNPSRWSIKQLTQLEHSISALETIGDSKIFIASGNQCEYWGIDQHKLRAYHERQITAEDQELPELPEV